MAPTVTSRDVQDVVSKLSSDKAKIREEGIKLLNTWLDGERSIAFCTYIGQSTAKLKANEIPHSESWPFLVTLLIQCVSLEVSASKRRLPKSIYAKSLRIVVQQAENSKFSGRVLPLLSVAKLLFNHIWDILSNVPSFQSEYGFILRHLLIVKDYRFHVRKRVYCSMMLWYLEKVETCLNQKITSQPNPKEEVFRGILTLQSLLENPPGDYPEDLREGIVNGFIGIFSVMRDEGKISRKLIECVNTYLLKDGPNLGCQSWKIHEILQQFVFRYWLSSHDRGLKDAFVTYARLQLSLIRDIAGGCPLVEQLLDVVSKDLDQSSMSSSGNLRNEVAKDDKLGILSESHRNLVELAALVVYKELSSVLLLPDKEIGSGWQTIWSCLIHGLPTFSNATAVVDAALMLLGKTISNDSLNACIIPQDVWDLRLFKKSPSLSGLYFILSYFSRKDSQGDIRDVLHLRKDILQAVLGHLKLKESTFNDERVVFLLPAATYALCAGHAIFEHNLMELSFPNAFFSMADACVCRVREEDDLHDFFECSAESLAKIDHYSSHKAFPENFSVGIRLPWRLRDPLLHDMEMYIEEALVHEEIKSKPLPDIFYVCALAANFMYGSVFGRQREEMSPFLSKMAHFLIELLDHATTLIGEAPTDFRSQGSLGPGSFDETSSVISSFRIFISSPALMELRNDKTLDVLYYCAIRQSMDKLLRAIVVLYEKNMCKRGSQSDMYSFATDIPGLSYSPTLDDKSRIVDMELDMDEDSKDVDTFMVGGKANSGLLSSMEKWKMGMISLMSCFFSVLHEATWDILFDLVKKESNDKVRENILLYICQHPCQSVIASISNLVDLISDMAKAKVDLKVDCDSIIRAISCFLSALLCSENVGKENAVFSLREGKFDQVFPTLGELLVEIAEVELVDWSGRVKLVDCICNFILLCPKVGQMLIERLLIMLRDCDYRVRFFAAKRIGVLFQTWEGHEELFQDICSNFGFPLVSCLKGKVITEKEVLAAASQPRPIMETVVITLAHLALHSEKIELEAVFMICVIAAIDPCQRELVSAVLDNLSRQLKYTSRSKYLEELMGPIIFYWVACGVNLVALVEIRKFFVTDVEPGHFLQYCCSWLLPALILHDDCRSILSWLAQFSGQSLKVLVRNHFVSIFSICMAFHSSYRPGSQKGGTALQSTILEIAMMSETERDKLIKKHMVSIVSCIISLTSEASEPAIPLFSMDTVVRAVRTVVDGFLDMEDCPANVGVLDKINILRPDRVFMFIIEIHHKVTAAMHHRHKRHRLAGIEVLVKILGYRAATPSTSSYLFNLIGQHIGTHALQGMCCRILSNLLCMFGSNTSKELTTVLGEQLQFLVSKLVNCCINCDANQEYSRTQSLEVLSVLRQLTVHSNPSLHDYIRELEPFPDQDLFDEIRKFHEGLCWDYSLRDHLLKFVKRSSYLPPRLLFWSLQALHKKFLAGESLQKEWNEDTKNRFWHDDHEVVGAVWSLLRVCSSNDADGVRVLVSDFISRVGIGDPHCVVFHLPGGSNHMHICNPITPERASEVNFTLNSIISEELVLELLKVLKKYLMDDSAVIVDMTSQVLRGILSTERGQDALSSLDSYERCLIEVHSSGVNVELVEEFLSELEQKFKAEAVPLEESSVWETDGKTFEMWICPLVFSLIGHCNDVILRFCQDIVFLKAEVAEMLLPRNMVDLACRKDVDVNFHKLMSLKVQEHIFIETNTLRKSIQVFLDALNELRLCYVMEICSSASAPSKRGSSKLARPSSYGSKTRSGSTKAGDSCVDALASVFLTSSWEKVYWLHIDYLLVAKSSLVSLCRSVLRFVGHILRPRSMWSIGAKSILIALPSGAQISLMKRSFTPTLKYLSQQLHESNEPDSLYGIIQTDKYEAAWRAGNWDFSLVYGSTTALSSGQLIKHDHFNESLHGCLVALQEGDFAYFHGKLKDSKQELVQSVSCASEESTEHIYSTIIKLQILYHLGTAWDLRWKDFPSERTGYYPRNKKVLSEPVIPDMDQMKWLSSDWERILRRTELHMNLLEPFIAFRRVLLNTLGCHDCTAQHLLQSASTLRKGSQFSQAAAALHEFKYLAVGPEQHCATSYWLGRLEEAKLLHSQGQNELAISLAKYISQNSVLKETVSDVYRLIGKWLAETRSSNSRTILENYLKPAVALADNLRGTHKKSIDRQSQTHFQLAHYADALFRSYEDRLTSSEWQAAIRLRKHKTLELEALIKRLKSSTKGEKTDYSVKIQELQRQLSMDAEEAEKLQDDRDNFLNLALEGYKRCLVIGDKYDIRVVFRLVSLWFALSSRQNVINTMLSTIEEVQSYKFVPLVYQIASRMGSSKDGQGQNSFQFSLVSLIKKMAIDHPYHTIFQLLALANGDRIKDKQRSRSSFVIDIDKKLAAENLLIELSAYHGAIIKQMKQMVEVYIKLAEIETRREDTNKRIPLPREIRGVRQLELVPVVTATFPVDRSCQYREGTFPYFKGLKESMRVMNGINAPKVVECLGSDGHEYRQLAKSGNDDLRQDAVMEQVFGLVNTFLQNHRDTRRRRLGIRTYKVVPFTPSAGVLEWVNGTLPVGEYLIGSMRNGGAHGRYGKGDWSFLKCREYMSNEKDKRKAFQEVYENFRPVMHHFFLERFSLPSDWFEKRLAYTRSVATSSMVGYIVGLGDRHSMNILIDQTTAEVVHIDLGVAFEQGLMLKTPERVPFRLTRDVIDGMGVTGVEGVFRRCCEETLSVMRTNKEALLTIVEVFIHDPLYKWALSPLKALQRQKEMDDDLETCFEGSPDEHEGNKDAARALMRVKQKLDGYEGGEMRSLHGQVQQLIQDAIDSERLCQMFPGWGAWL